MVNHILFVCHGNICRSPMAEYIMKDLVRKRGVEDDFVIESCAVSSEEIGHDIYPPARRELERHGIPCGHRSARRMSTYDYRRFDVIAVMDRSNLYLAEPFVGEDPDHKVHLIRSFAGESGDVPDPWYTGDFSETFDILERSCNALLDRLISKKGECARL